MTDISPRRSADTPRPANRAMAMKWLVVLAALSVATVLDGLSISDQTKPAETASSDRAAITLPSDRCGPGCTIMVASNQTVDAVSAQSR